MGMQHMIQYFPRILRKQMSLEFIINCKKRISTPKSKFVFKW